MEVIESRIYFVESDGLPEYNENTYFIYNENFVNGIPVKHSKVKGNDKNTWVSLTDNQIYYNIDKYLIFDEPYNI